MQPQITVFSSDEAHSADFALRLRYKGMERTTTLPLTPRIVGQLAVEAASRGLSIAELVGELVSLTMEKGLAPQVLDGGPNWTVRSKAGRARHRLYRRVSSCRG